MWWTHGRQHLGGAFLPEGRDAVLAGYSVAHAFARRAHRASVDALTSRAARASGKASSPLLKHVWASTFSRCLWCASYGTSRWAWFGGGVRALRSLLTRAHGRRAGMAGGSGIFNLSGRGALNTSTSALSPFRAREKSLPLRTVWRFIFASPRTPVLSAAPRALMLSILHREHDVVYLLTGRTRKKTRTGGMAPRGLRCDMRSLLARVAACLTTAHSRCLLHSFARHLCRRILRFISAGIWRAKPILQRQTLYRRAE